MDLKQLATFVQVAELGSFTRAASVLRIAQPALSRQVRTLEVELRQPLFDRNGRGVTLTPAGQRLLAHGRGILQQVERARQDLEEQRGAAAGLLAVGLPPSVGRLVTAPLVGAFGRQFPRATLSLVEGLSSDTLEWLAQGRIDCAVVYNAMPAPAFDLQPVLEEPLLLIAARPPGAPLRAGRPRPATLAQVAAQPLVMPARPHGIRMRVETALAEAGLKARIALEVGSVPAILDLVRRPPQPGWHAVLSQAALRGSEGAADFVARPILRADGRRRLGATLWIASSAERPRGPLLEQAVPMLRALLLAELAAIAQGTP